jgi:polyhydroxyalkanoate synthesis repressor PhaR
MTRGVRLASERAMAYVIKRYSNRKLYDTQESRYVTLEELEEMIRTGKEIRVTDASTGEDLTSVTLAQILLENERTHRAALPTALLHQLIKHGEAWQDFVQRSLRTSLEGIITSQREADRVFREWSAKAGWLPSKEREPEARRGREEKAEAESLRQEVAALKEKLRSVERRIPRKRRK